MIIKSKELEEYLKSSLSAIKKGVEETGDFRINSPIEFDLAVVNIKEGEGGFKIYVAKTGGKLKAEKINRIKFSVDVDRRDEGRVMQMKPRNVSYV